MTALAVALFAFVTAAAFLASLPPVWPADGTAFSTALPPVLPATSVNPNPGPGELIRILPFGKPVPSRRVGLAWRRSFPRPEAIEALRKAILACNLPQVEKL